MIEKEDLANWMYETFKRLDPDHIKVRFAYEGEDLHEIVKDCLVKVAGELLDHPPLVLIRAMDGIYEEPASSKSKAAQPVTAELPAVPGSCSGAATQAPPE